MQIIYGNGTIPPPTLLGTTAFSGKGVHAATMDSLGDMFMTGQSGGVWARDASGSGQFWTAGSNTEAIDFFSSTLYTIMDAKVTRLGSVGTIPNAAGAAPTLTAVSSAYGGTTCYNFIFEVGVVEIKVMLSRAASAQLACSQRFTYARTPGTRLLAGCEHAVVRRRWICWGLRQGGLIRLYPFGRLLRLAYARVHRLWSDWIDGSGRGRLKLLDLLHGRESDTKLRVAYEFRYVRCNQHVHDSGQYTAEGSHAPSKKLFVDHSDAEFNTVAVAGSSPDTVADSVAFANSNANADPNSLACCGSDADGNIKPECNWDRIVYP